MGIIEIKITLAEKEGECKLISAFNNDFEIKAEIENILKNSNIDEIIPKIKNEKKRYSFDPILTKYIISTFNPKISKEEKNEKIKLIIREILGLTENDIVLLWRGNIRITQFGIKKKKKIED